MLTYSTLSGLLPSLAPRLRRILIRRLLTSSGITEVTWLPPEGSPLRAGMAPVRLAMDHVIGPRTLAFGHWHDEHCQMLRDKLLPGTDYHLVDVGANVGLVSRQLLTSPGLRFVGADCFEPDSHNHLLLHSNLAPFDAVRTHAAALSDHDGFADLFRGSRNAGDISLAPTGKLRARNDLRSTQVALYSAERVGQEILDALAPQTRLVWKSDTQGHDIKIAAALPEHFWDRVDAALIEVGSVATSLPEIERFMGIVESFSRCLSIKFGARAISAGKIRNFISQANGRELDLLLFRN